MCCVSVYISRKGGRKPERECGGAWRVYASSASGTKGVYVWVKGAELHVYVPVRVRVRLSRR